MNAILIKLKEMDLDERWGLLGRPLALYLVLLGVVALQPLEAQVVSLVIICVFNCFIGVRLIYELAKATYMQGQAFMFACTVGSVLIITIVAEIVGQGLSDLLLLVMAVQGFFLVLPCMFSTKKRNLLVHKRVFAGLFLAATQSVLVFIVWRYI